MANGFTNPADVSPQIATPQPVTPAAAPVQPVQPVQPAPAAVPELTATGQTTSTSTTQRQRSAGVDKALRDLESSTQLQNQAFQTLADAEVERSNIEANAIAQQLAEQDRLAAQRNEALSVADQEIQQKQAALDSQIEAFKNQAPESFWGSRSTANKVGLAISAALGAVGSALSGGPNAALQIINSQINDFVNQQTRRQKQQLSAIEQGRAGVQDARSARQRINQEQAALKIAALERINLQTEQLLARTNSESAIAKLQQLQAGVQAEAAQTRADIEKDFAATTTTDVTEQLVRQTAGGGLTDAGKPQTQGQLEAEGFLDRAEPALQQAENIEALIAQDPEKLADLQDNMTSVLRSKNVESIPVVGGILSGLMATEAQQAAGDTLFPGSQVEEGPEFLAAATDFIRTVLRKESGAAIAADEFNQEYSRFFPVKGDTPESLRQKQRARRTAIRALRREAGRSQSRPLYFEQQRGQ